MGKHLDAVKPFDEFRAPWETESGSDAEIDKSKLKRYIYGLFTDKAKAQDSRDEAVENVTKLETDLEAARKDAASANGEEAQKRIDKLTADLDKARAKVTELETAKEQADLRSEVLGSLDPKYAKYVTGTTREELEKSLEQVKSDFNLGDEGDGKDDEDDDENVGRVTPRQTGRVRNPADRNPDEGSNAIDFGKVADDILSGGSVFR